jgi:hypothetical protein
MYGARQRIDRDVAFDDEHTMTALGKERRVGAGRTCADYDAIELDSSFVHRDQPNMVSACPVTATFSIAPMRSISTRTRSLAFRYCGGFIAAPTPAGVPEKMTSPDRA